MDTGLAINLLEHLGSSEDPIELYGSTKTTFASFGFFGRAVDSPNKLDVNIENDARKIQVIYASIRLNRDVRGTLSGMVKDRLRYGSESAEFKQTLKHWISVGEVCDNWCPVCGKED